MADSSFTQPSFLGGEWSPYAQGRIEHPDYRRAMNVCRNIIPLEEGCAIRRSGTRELGVTRKNNPGIIRTFYLANNVPISIELTWDSVASHSYFRFWSLPYSQTGPFGGNSCLVSNGEDTIASISAATPAVVQTTAAHAGWATGDTVVLYPKISSNINSMPTVWGRQFTITKIDSTHFSLADAFTGASVNGATLNWGGVAGNDVISHIYEIQAPFNNLADIQSVRFVQADSTLFLLQSNYPPSALFITAIPPNTPVFSLVTNVIANTDGPYLDPIAGTSQLLCSSGTVDGAGPTMNFTNDGLYSFTSNDVGRAIRLFSIPKAWTSGTHYLKGDVVYYNNQCWIATLEQNGAGVNAFEAPPGGSAVQPQPAPISVVPWSLTPNQGQWVYGVINSVASSVKVNVTLNRALPFYSASGAPTDTGNGNTIDLWQLGAYTTGHYPTCGCFHEGRLWLGGAYPGRIDGSIAGFVASTTGFQTFLPEVAANLFSPTTFNGQVTDQNAINYAFNGQTSSFAVWFEPDQQGINIGTVDGEWLVQASNINNVLSPTNIQSHRVSRYGCAPIEPRRTGTSLLMIQFYQLRLLEYLPDAFTQRYVGKHINDMAKHLATANQGFKELAYQEEITPVIWAVTKSGALVGCTYRRVSRFTTENPVFNAWHRHDHGAGRTWDRITSSSSDDGTVSALMTITQKSGKNYIEQMVPLFSESQDQKQGWFLDAGVVPVGTDSGGGSSLKLYGAWTQAGNTVSVTIAGLDCGDYTVAADGSVTVPYGSDPDGLLTPSYLTTNSANFGVLNANLDIGAGPTRVTVPVIIGNTYTSQGQLLRPAAEIDTHTRTGPAVGMTRRLHMFSANVAGARGVSFGVDFNHLYPANFRSADQNTLLASSAPFTGIHWDQIDADYDFDNMLCWQITRPVPCAILSLTGYMGIAER